MPNLKCFMFSFGANVLYYFVYSVPRGDVCVCVGLALFLWNLVCCCTVKIRLRGLECAPWFNKAYLQRIWHRHQHAVSLCEFAYLCRLIERSTSLLSSMKMLAVDALIVVKRLSLTDTHCGLVERSITAQNMCLRTHTDTHLPCGVCKLHDMFSNTAASSFGL